MNINAIQTFLAVVRTRNLNRAAQEMNVTQSAVTARLDTLERTLATKLLIRSRKGATLTKAGFAFLESAEVITRTWQNVRARTDLPRGVTGLFSFVCDPSLWAGLGDTWISDIRAQHSETAIQTWSGLVSDARPWLQSGLSDAALLPEPLIAPGFDSREFSIDQLLQVSTTPRGTMRWDPTYVFVDYGPAFRARHTQVWPGKDTAAMSFNNPEWALTHLLAHGGSAYLPERMIGACLVAGSLHLVDGATSFTRRTFLTWREGSEAAFSWLSQADH